MTLLARERPAGPHTPGAAYDRLAPDYDAFVAAPDYERWLAGLLSRVAPHLPDRGRALDVGCGTGRSLGALLAAGYDAEGCDPSPAMLREARARLGAGVALAVGALPEPLPAGPRVDLATALNDVLNYVTPAALPQALAAIAVRLRPGGLLLFDVNTPRTFAGFFAATFVRHAGSRFFVWEGLPAEGATHTADLHAFAADPTAAGRWTRTVSRHVQHHHTEEAVAAALAAGGFQLLEVLGVREDGALDDHADDALHTKLLYLARRR
jgi:SAM-dependent methyltransferase